MTASSSRVEVRDHAVSWALQAVAVPFGRIADGELGHRWPDLRVHQSRTVSVRSSLREDLVALAVDRLALAVDDVVVLDDALADVEVVALDAGLGPARWSCSRCRDSMATSSSSPTAPSALRPGRTRSASSGRPRARGRSATSRGRPGEPERPRSWLSMRRASWRSVPMMCSPPASTTCSWSAAVTRFASARAASTRSACASAGFVPCLWSSSAASIRVAAEQDVGPAAGHVGRDRHRARSARPGPRSRPPARGTSRSARCA